MAGPVPGQPAHHLQPRRDQTGPGAAAEVNAAKTAAPLSEQALPAGVVPHPGCAPAGGGPGGGIGWPATDRSDARIPGAAPTLTCPGTPTRHGEPGPATRGPDRR